MAKKQAVGAKQAVGKVKKLQQRTRFANASGVETLTIQLKEGRRGGFNVRAALKRKGEKKAQTGTGSAFATLDDATTEVLRLSEEARAAGWKQLSRNISGAGAFTTIPSAE